MRRAALQLEERRLELALDPQDRLAHRRIERQDLGGLIPRDVRSGNLSALGDGELPERRIDRHGSSRERNHVRIHPDFASLLQPTIRLAQRRRDVRERSARRAQDDIEERRDAQRERVRERRLDVRVDLRLVEFGEHVAREVLDAESEHAEARAPHRVEPLGRHGVDPIGADELQGLRQRAAGLRGDDRLAERQDALVLREHEDVVLEDDGAHARVRADDALEHLHAFLGVESRDARDAALRLVQEVGGGAEGTAHRAVVERDEAHRADLGETRLARRLARQRPHPAGFLEPLPVGGVGHPLVGRVEDGVAQLGAGEGLLAHRQALAVGAPLRRSGDALEGRSRAQPRHELEQRPLALAEHDAIERPEAEHELGPEGGLHPPRDQQRMRLHPARHVRELEIEAQRHAGGRAADDVPGTPEELALERPRHRQTAAAVRVEDLDLGAGGFEYAGQAPHAERWGEKGVFPAVRVVWPDQQDPRRVHQSGCPPGSGLGLRLGPHGRCNHRRRVAARLIAVLCRHKTVTHREQRDARGVVQLELAHQIRAMLLDRLHAEP